MSVSWRAVFQKQEVSFQHINQMQVLYLFLDALNSVLAFGRPTFWVFWIMSESHLLYIYFSELIKIPSVQYWLYLWHKTVFKECYLSVTYCDNLTCILSVLKCNLCLCSALTVVCPGYLCYTRNWSVWGTWLAVKWTLKTLTQTGWLFHQGHVWYKWSRLVTTKLVCILVITVSGTDIWAGYYSVSTYFVANFCLPSYMLQK